MRFVETGLEPATLIEIEPIEDERGLFARTWDQSVFAERGLNSALVQCNISFNSRRGTLRGLHYQVSPFEEAKLVRCTSGEIFDVLVDLRPESPTFKKSYDIYLSSENRRMLYVPEGFAHGFLTSKDETEVFYQMTHSYSPDHARGVRWDDPAFGIVWPFEPVVMSETDRNYPDFEG